MQDTAVPQSRPLSGRHCLLQATSTPSHIPRWRKTHRRSCLSHCHLETAGTSCGQGTAPDSPGALRAPASSPGCEQPHSLQCRPSGACSSRLQLQQSCPGQARAMVLARLGVVAVGDVHLRLPSPPRVGQHSSPMSWRHGRRRLELHGQARTIESTCNFRCTCCDCGRRTGPSLADFGRAGRRLRPLRLNCRLSAAHEQGQGLVQG